jgi:hypothetical protein
MPELFVFGQQGFEVQRSILLQPSQEAINLVNAQAHP